MGLASPAQEYIETRSNLEDFLFAHPAEAIIRQPRLWLNLAA